MNNRRISTILVILMLMPLLNGVQADGEDGTYLEAKNLQATVDSINETVTVSWDNIDTNDFMILEDLKKTNYSLYRSDEPLNSSNYLQAELVRENIQACTEADTFTSCKNREHVVVYTIPPATDGNFYYGVISTLQNGSVSDNFTIGNATVSQPVYEFGSSITSPYGLQANYVVDNSTTQLSWVDVSRVDASVDSNHTTTLWSHAFRANSSNWDSINKTQIGTTMDSSANSFEIVHPALISRSIYYTVMHSFDGEEDTRFLSGNTLTQPLVEDNIGSIITGTLQAQFNASSAQTSMNWSGAVIEDANHTLHIWRSISSITDFNADGVVEIVQLPANSTHYNYTVAPGFNGESHYLVTLSDELGNHQTDLSSAPHTHLHEYTLSENQNIVTYLSASHSEGVTALTWTDLVNHSEATYQVWRSTSQITSANFGSASVALLATVDSGVEAYNHVLASGVSQEAWYAVTAVASFGTQNLTLQQTNISVSLNSLDDAVIEDTKNPVASAVLTATYHVNGTTEISWNGDGLEQGTTWKIYRNLYAEMNEESYWESVGQAENVGTTQLTVFVPSVAQYGESFSPVYALSGTDAFGNTIDFEDWTLSAPVLEDRKTPNVQMIVYDSQNNAEASRWFDGGENSAFSHLAAGTYTLKFDVLDDAVTIDYTLSTDASQNTLNLAQDLPEISLTLSEQMTNVTVSFVVYDETGNAATFSTLFCTTCLIVPEEVNQTVEDSNEDDVNEVQNDDDSSSNETLLIGICAGLVMVVLFLRLRGSKPAKTPSGLPSKSEDQWISKYVSEQ
ncbi:MAG: hypothetical protein CMA63_06320 [Euryarchaeota archaeon]|nr:hypothetical protein [Euryarchaeota archaeon]